MEYPDNALIVKVDTDDEYEFARDMQVTIAIALLCHNVRIIFWIHWVDVDSCSTAICADPHMLP